MDENEIMTASRYGDKPRVLYIKAELLRKRNKLDFFLNRFLDTFGRKLDVPNPKPEYTQFFNDKCSEYSKINRLLRIADAYL